MRKKRSIKNKNSSSENDASSKAESLIKRYFKQIENTELEKSDANFRENEILDTLKARIASRKKTKHHRLKIAASFIGFICISGLAAWVYFTSINSRPDTMVLTAEKAKLSPGGNRATLTLADGSVIDLSDHSNGKIASQAATEISKTDDSMLVYDVKDAGSSDKMVYNSISTPRGGQFAVFLPDGSKVWLNAESKLTYPTSFQGDNRIVELTGEGYFEIKRDEKRPFKIKSNDQVVTVLGTKFNINSYTNEQYTRTTLLEGSVQIEKDTEAIILKPGEQAKVKDGIEINKVNTLTAVAWKSGDFIFRNDGIQDIMRQVARWYDVDVEYEGLDESLKFGGIVSRSQDLSTVLSMLEETGRVKFELLIDANKTKRRVRVTTI